MKSMSLSVKEKIAYGLGDTASNIVYQVVINFMLYFYTDVYGISAAAAGTLMLVVRIFDGITDPLMGAVADRTKSKWGRYRPWLIWMSIPYGVLAVLAFTTPDFSIGAKLVYAYITYALLTTAYTAINIPYSALGGVITTDTQDRASVQSWRFALAMVGGALVAASTLPLVTLLGGGNEQLGFSLTMVVLSVIAILCFVACFAFTKERIHADESKPKTKISIDIKAMFANSQWQIIALITLILMTSGAMRGGVTAYYVSYYLNSEGMISTFLTASMLAGVAGALFSNLLVKKYCKVNIMKVAAIGIFVFNGALIFVSREGLYLALFFAVLANFAHMTFIPMLFSTVPDTVDYGQKKMAKGAMAMFFSGHLLALKFGNAIGGALAGWMLGWYGYVANAVQTAHTLDGIVLIYAASSVVSAVLILLCLNFYKLKRGWDQS